MILRLKGHWVKVNKMEWKRLSFSKKCGVWKAYFCEQAVYLKDCLKDYWIGYVEVHEDMILCEDCHKIYSISIICGRYKRGQYFSGIRRDTVNQLVTEWEFSDKKSFRFCLDLGSGMLQDYVFSKCQKNMLIRDLKPLLEQSWYENLDEDSDCF